MSQIRYLYIKPTTFLMNNSYLFMVTGFLHEDSLDLRILWTVLAILIFIFIIQFRKDLLNFIGVKLTDFNEKESERYFSPFM